MPLLAPTRRTSARAHTETVVDDGTHVARVHQPSRVVPTPYRTNACQSSPCRSHASSWPGCQDTSRSASTSSGGQTRRMVLMLGSLGSSTAALTDAQSLDGRSARDGASPHAAARGSHDFTVTAPGQLILGSTPAGLIVNDSAGGYEPAEGEPYLAEISDAGELTRVGAIPAHDDVVVSPGAGWLAWTAPGAT